MDNFETSLNDLLVDTFNAILKYEEKSIKSLSDVAVTVGEVHILEAVARSQHPPTLSELAGRLGVALPSVTVAIKKLEQKNLATKTGCADDGRRWRLSLTALGQKTYRAHELFHRRMIKTLSDGFSAVEKDILLKAMGKLRLFFAQKAEGNA